MDSLARYVMETAGEPRIYGWSDCAPWVLRWVTLATGLTLATPDYHSALAAMRLIRVHGGVPALYRHYAQRLGLGEAGTPRRGDIGVFAAEGALTGVTGGICMAPDTWAAKLHDGRVKLVRVPAVTVWALPRSCSGLRQSPG